MNVISTGKIECVTSQNKTDCRQFKNSIAIHLETKDNITHTAKYIIERSERYLNIRISDLNNATEISLGYL